MITGQMFRDGVISAANNIANSRQAVDALNIFPVPDGDTGTNMSMTIASASDDIKNMEDDSDVGDVAKEWLQRFFVVQEETRALFFHLYSVAFQRHSKVLKKQTATILLTHSVWEVMRRIKQ